MITIDSKNFNEEVIGSSVPVLVEFWSYDCKACEDANPFLFELTDVYKDKIKIMKINVQQEIDLVRRFMIKSVPTFIIFKNTKAQEKIVGFRNKIELEKKIRQII